MNLVKKILIGLGALFVLVIALIALFAVGSNDFRDSHVSYVEHFMSEFSETWEVAVVHEKLTNDFLAQVDSPNGRQALGLFQALGKFEQMSDIEVQNFTSGTAGKSGRLTFKAKFANGPALVEITLFEKDGKTLVHGLHITPSGSLPMKSRKHEA
jgi:hypothetical protein